MVERIIIESLDELRPGDCVQHPVAGGVLVTRDWVGQHNAGIAEESLRTVARIARDLDPASTPDSVARWLDSEADQARNRSSAATDPTMSA